MGAVDDGDLGRGGSRGAVFGVGKLMLVVACFGVIFWAARSARETVRPAAGLARSLHSGPTPDRRKAAEELGQVDPGDAGVAAAALAAALHDEDEEVRDLAAIGLQLLVKAPTPHEFDHAALASALGEALGDRSAQVRDRALAALLEVARVAPIGPPAELADLLARGEPASARAKAAAALPAFRLDRRGTVSRLGAVLMDKDAEVVQAAAAALGKIGPEALPARPRLIAILKGPEGPMSPSPSGAGLTSPAIASALAIGSISTDPRNAAAGVAALEEALRAGPRSCHPAAAEALFLMGGAASPATPTLIATLVAGARPDGGEGFESWAARALGELAPGTEWAGPTIRGLIEGLDAKSAGMRYHSAQALGKFGPEASAALPRLRAVEKGSDPHDAATAATAIEKIGGEPAAPARPSR